MRDAYVIGIGTGEDAIADTETIIEDLPTALRAYARILIGNGVLRDDPGAIASFVTVAQSAFTSGRVDGMHHSSPDNAHWFAIFRAQIQDAPSHG